MMPEPRLAEPDGCRWCNIPQREHVSLWKPPVGWHQWAEPTDAQRLERMKARRAARQPAPPQPPTGLLAGATTRADWHRPFAGIHVRDRAHAVALLRAYLAWRDCKHDGWSSQRGPNFPWESQIREVLRGRDLACWCPLPAGDGPDHCHGAVLLEIANSPAA